LEEGPASSGQPTPLRSDWESYGSSRLYNPHSYGLASINPTTDPVHDGQELWDELVGVNGNFELTFNGHYLDDTDNNPFGPLTTAYQMSVGTSGNEVHEMVFNAQQKANGGNGYLRLLEFLDDGMTVQVRTYSPTLDVWLTSSYNEFQVELSPVAEPVPEASSFALITFGLLSLSLVGWRRRRPQLNNTIWASKPALATR